jgi:peroxiredoxin
MSVAQAEERAARRQADRDAELAVAASWGAASRALRAGARAPLFTLKDADGRQHALETLLHAGPVVLHFFRGPWCAFGEESLGEFAATCQDINGLGANAVAIAPPSSAAVQRVASPMRSLQDIDMKVARAYGLAFDLPKGLRAGYTALGYAPPLAGSARPWFVPLPATYLLDRNGVVVLAYIDVDYRRHFEPGSLLTALKALQARQEPARRVGRL